MIALIVALVLLYLLIGYGTVLASTTLLGRIPHVIRWGIFLLWPAGLLLWALAVVFIIALLAFAGMLIGITTPRLDDRRLL